MKIVWRTERWERILLGVLGLVLIIGATIFMAGYREATTAPVVVRYQVNTAPIGFKPLRIAVISDTHIAPMLVSMDRDGAKAMVERVRELQPDLVVLAGDYAGTEAGFDAAIESLSGLGAPLGVVAVLGNHEYEDGRNARDMARTLRQAGMAPLVNDHVDVGPVIIAGLDDLWNGSSDIGEVGKAIRDANGRPVILVSHNPDVFPQVSKEVALTVAGHTHGSHAVFPIIGSVVSSSRYGQRYRRGHIVENGRSMVVSSGAGGVAFRWNVPPEIALVTLGPRS